MIAHEITWLGALRWNRFVLEPTLSNQYVHEEAAPTPYKSIRFIAESLHRETPYQYPLVL